MITFNKDQAPVTDKVLLFVLRIEARHKFWIPNVYVLIL